MRSASVPWRDVKVQIRKWRRASRRAAARWGWRWRLAPVLGAVAVAGLWVAAPFVFERWGHLAPVKWRLPLDLAAAVWLYGLVIVPAATLALPRWWMMRRCRRERRAGGVCPSCRFSLVGLPVRDGAIRCPECGRIVRRAEM